MRREDVEPGLLRKQIAHFSSQIVTRASTCLPFLPVFSAGISIKFLTVIRKCHNCSFFLIFICSFMHLFNLFILFTIYYILLIFLYLLFIYSKFYFSPVATCHPLSAVRRLLLPLQTYLKIQSREVFLPNSISV